MIFLPKIYLYHRPDATEVAANAGIIKNIFETT